VLRSVEIDPEIALERAGSIDSRPRWKRNARRRGRWAFGRDFFGGDEDVRGQNDRWRSWSGSIAARLKREGRGTWEARPVGSGGQHIDEERRECGTVSRSPRHARGRPLRGGLVEAGTRLIDTHEKGAGTTRTRTRGINRASDVEVVTAGRGDGIALTAWPKHAAASPMLCWRTGADFNQSRREPPGDRAGGLFPPQSQSGRTGCPRRA